MLLRGESAVGESVAKRARQQLEMVQDKVVVDYERTRTKTCPRHRSQ